MMASFDLERMALRNYNVKRERSTSPFQMSSPSHPFGHIDENVFKTVSLSAICKESGPYFSGAESPVLSPPFSWRQATPELVPYDFAWNRPLLSRTGSPLSSHADCSLTEDGSTNTLSPHIASTFEPTDYTNPHSFPGSPQENWVQVDDTHTYHSIPFGNGGSSAVMHVAPYAKPHYGLHMPMPLPSQEVPLFDDETAGHSRKRKLILPNVKQEGEDVEYQEREEDEEDAGSDYAPRPRKKSRAPRSVKPTKTKQTKSRLPATSKGHNYPYSRHNHDIEQYIARTNSYGLIPCPHCPEQLHNKTSLIRHITALHTRLFACTFRIYGCTSTFGSKNEWKRHVATKHLRTAYWQCDMGRCAPSKPSDQPKEFNRKDLFMQHIRRMHMPTFLKDKEEMDASIDNIARDSYKHVRNPPPRSICGFCYAVGKKEDFSGPGSWEHRMEHVGKHLESPDCERKECYKDQALEEWLLREGLIIEDGRGGYILRSLVEDGRGKR